MWRSSLVVVAACSILACGTTHEDLCDHAADVSHTCGGYDPTGGERSACTTRVQTACSPAEESAYVAYLQCANDRCATASPDRQIDSHCGGELTTVSATCYDAGIVGNSDYRYC